MKKLLLAVATLVITTAANAATTLKIATAAPEASSWVQAMRASAQEIKERTDGRVVIKYYVGGIQGSDAQVLKKMRIRNLHGAAFTPSALSDIYPDINLYGLPLIFNSYDEASYVRKHLDQRLIDGLADAGYITFGFASTGFAMVMSNDPVRGVEDLKGKKVWVPEGDRVSYKSMEALSVSPTALPLTDVMVGLQTELLDIVPVSPIGALFLQWYTRVKYVTDLPLVYTFGFMVIDKTMYDKISAADQAIVREVMTRTYSEFDGVGEADNDGALQAILDKGLQRINVAAEEKKRIRATMAQANRTFAEQGVVSVDLYEAMLKFRDEYRNGQASRSDQIAANESAP